MKREKFVILGGGLIGTFSDRELSRRDIETEVLSRLDVDLAEETSVKLLESYLRTPVCLLLTAAVTRLKENSERSRKTNIAIANHVSAAIAKTKIANLIFLSTVDVYGVVSDDVLINENLPLRAQDEYSSSKIQSEEILARACREYGIPLTILRLTGVFGSPDLSTMWKLCSSALRDGKIAVYDGGRSRRDFLHAQDLCSLFQEIYENPISGCFNVATGFSSSIEEIAQRISQHTGAIVDHQTSKDGEKRSANLSFDLKKLREAYPRFRARSTLDWVPDYLEQVDAFLQRPGFSKVRGH
jgi:nucleoside-diphosphate-sugar epimerase